MYQDQATLDDDFADFLRSRAYGFCGNQKNLSGEFQNGFI